MKVPESAIIKCAKCGAKSSLRVWNDNTFKHCLNRQMKRAFKHLTDDKSYLRKSDTWYKCPICSMWMRGCNLHIIAEDKSPLSRLGRESVLIVDEEYKGLG
jgi:hypothetical protein